MSGVLQDSESAIVQIGLVVNNLNDTMALLERLGLGPFSTFTAEHPAATVRGCQASYRVNLGIAQQGGVELELIEYESGTTIQKEFLDECGEGLHHILFQVKDIESTLVKMTEAGLEVLQQDRFEGGGGLAYVSSNQLGGVVFELVQYPAHYRRGEPLVYCS